jgi:hypothetical protein
MDSMREVDGTLSGRMLRECGGLIGIWLVGGSRGGINGGVYLASLRASRIWRVTGIWSRRLGHRNLVCN